MSTGDIIIRFANKGQNSQEILIERNKIGIIEIGQNSVLIPRYLLVNPLLLKFWIDMTKSKMAITYAIALSVLGLALSSSLITTALAAKSTTSGVHFQGPAPQVTKNGNTATSTAFTLAGLGQGTGTAQLTVTGFFSVQCRNPGGNIAPGQNTAATGSSQTFGFTAQNGKASVPSLQAQLDPSTVDTSQSCPNSSWTPIVGQGTVTSATLTVTFNGQTIFTQTV